MWIEVVIPFDENNRLAGAYNRALRQGKSGWVLFLDHDVFLCNPNWYTICLRAIENLKNDPKAALITCVAGGQRHHQIVRTGAVINDSIGDHILIAKDLYSKWGNTLKRTDDQLAGFFFLLNRHIAKNIGFRQINSTINGIDADFCSRLYGAGYHAYELPGLYVYHRRGMKRLKKEFVPSIQT